MSKVLSERDVLLILPVSRSPLGVHLRGHHESEPTIATDPWESPHARAADLVVAAWVCQPPAVRRKIAMAERILHVQSIGVDLYCIGLTRNGYPLHPSRVAYTERPTAMRDFE
jgi:hypothetical protein